MRRLFLDTEFTTLSRHRRLISLALVDPAGPECYVELGEGWALEDCSEFVVQIVLPQLDLPVRGMSREEARTALLSFLDDDAEVEIISDALAWDWPCCWSCSHRLRCHPASSAVKFAACWPGWRSRRFLTMRCSTRG